MYRIGLTLFLMIACWSYSMAQHSFLKDFRAYQEGQKVDLVWIINGGNTCFGMTIERALDNKNFLPIGEIPGICGSNEGDERYNFTDEYPTKNNLNYYRLKFGGVGYSDTQSVEFLIFGKTGFIIINNPLLTESYIQFPNPTQEHHILKVFDLSGKLRLVKETTSRKFRITRTELRSGVYFLELTSSHDAAPTLYGKLLVK